MEDLCFIRWCFETKQLSRKKIINIHYQSSLPNPIPSASSLKIDFQISDFDTYCQHYWVKWIGSDHCVFGWTWKLSSNTCIEGKRQQKRFPRLHWQGRISIDHQNEYICEKVTGKKLIGKKHLLIGILKR